MTMSNSFISRRRQSFNTSFTPRQQIAISSAPNSNARNLLIQSFRRQSEALPRQVLVPRRGQIVRASVQRNTPRSIMNPTFMNGGAAQRSLAQTRVSSAPVANGYQSFNSGERDVRFDKEYIFGTITLSQSVQGFVARTAIVHPATSNALKPIAAMYSRYKVLSFSYRYRAACSTQTQGSQFSGVVYASLGGGQAQIPSSIFEAQTMELFSIGPVWEHHQQWRSLKRSHLMERWFETDVTTDQPDAYPARIIFGVNGVPVPQGTASLDFGYIEVRASFLFSGLAQAFTAPKTPSNVVANVIATEDGEVVQTNELFSDGEIVESV